MIQPMPQSKKQTAIQPVPQSRTSSLTPTPQPQNVPSPTPRLRSVVTHNDIAQRAYDIYVQTGCHEGQCLQNWLQAEKDVHDKGLVVCQAEHRTLEVFAPDAIAPQ